MPEIGDELAEARVADAWSGHLGAWRRRCVDRHLRHASQLRVCIDESAILCLKLLEPFLEHQGSGRGGDEGGDGGGGGSAGWWRSASGGSPAAKSLVPLERGATHRVPILFGHKDCRSLGGVSGKRDGTQSSEEVGRRRVVAADANSRCRRCNRPIGQLTRRRGTQLAPRDERSLRRACGRKGGERRTGFYLWRFAKEVTGRPLSVRQLSQRCPWRRGERAWRGDHVRGRQHVAPLSFSNPREETRVPPPPASPSTHQAGGPAQPPPRSPLRQAATVRERERWQLR